MNHAEPHAASRTVDPQRRRRQIFAAFWGAVVVAALVFFRSTLVPFVLAVLIAYVLSPLVRRLDGAVVAGRRVPRWAAIIGIYAAMLTTMGVSLRVGVPAIVGASRSFVQHEVPRLATQAKIDWLPRVRGVYQRVLGADDPTLHGSPEISALNEPTAVPERPASDLELRPLPGGGLRLVLPDDGLRIEAVGSHGYVLRPSSAQREGPPHDAFDDLATRARGAVTGYSGDILRAGQLIVRSVVGGVFAFFITLMLSAYILLTEAEIMGFLRELVQPRQRGAFDELLRRLDRGLSGVVRGQLIICAVNGVLSAVGFAIAKLPYWPLLALLAAVFSLVPIFGSILSSVPAVLVGLRSGIGTAVFVLVWIVGIHQLEANLLNPKIMGDAAKIHPVLVVFSLLVGEHFFGILGALLAVPAFSILQSVFLHWRKYALEYTPAEESAAAAATGDASSST